VRRLLFAILVFPAAEAQAAPANHAELLWPGGASASFSANGTTYWATLKPEKDVDGNIVLIDLVLTRTGRARNLLEPKGNWHGIQPFDFGARDFRHGATRSIYGTDRIFPIGRERLRVHVRSVEVGHSGRGPTLRRLGLDLVLRRVGSGEWR
jgi:hypothetical protein